MEKASERHQLGLTAWRPTLGLLLLGVALAGLYGAIGRQRDLDAHVPEFIGLALAAGALYLVGVYWVDRYRLGTGALLIILASALAFRFFLIGAPPQLSDDVYRYQWEGRVERAGLNPYTVYPAKPGLERFQNLEYPIQTARQIPTVYPPLSEIAFSCIRTISGYKRLFTALDLASISVLLLMLAALGQPLQRVLIYAWNPTVIVAFALSGHHDSLAILTLLLANYFIIARRPLAGMGFLTLSVLSKFFPAIVLPYIIQFNTTSFRERRDRPPDTGLPATGRTSLGAVLVVLAGVMVAGYLPFLGAGRRVLGGLGSYATLWEANDSLFRLIILAGNSRAQARLVGAVLMLSLVAYALKHRLDPLRCSLFLIAGVLLLSPDAFPWYFTWTVPFLCFDRSRFGRPWLLTTVLSVLGYHPVVAYAAGQAYRHSPLMLTLEYAPLYGWLGFEAVRRVRETWGTASRG